MAITGGDVQSVQNYFAMNELNTHLGALTAQLGKIPGTYGKLGKELAVYSQELANIKAGKKALIVMAEKDENVVKSAANIPGVRTALVGTMNVYEIVNHESFIVTKEAVEKIQEVYI